MEENIEKWKDIPEYEGLYQVSNFGKIKSLPRNTTKGGILKPSKSKDSYLKVTLTKDGKVKYFLVHRLVALAFLENPNNLPQVNHKNEIKTDNRVENLEFCTPQYNVTYNNAHIKRGEKIKGKFVGENHPMFGRHHTEESKNKIGKASKGRIFSEEAKQKMSKAHKGKPKYYRRKPILQFTKDMVFIKEFDSSTIASKELNLSQGNIIACCKGVRNKCGEYKWVYKSDYKPTNTQLELKFD